jgi:hypothetical protein
MSEENLDRGDVLPDPVAPVAEAPAVEAPAAEAPATETPATETPAAEQPRDEKGKFIPQDRHKSILEAERAKRETAERQLVELQGRLAEVSRTADVTKLEEKLSELRTADRKAIMAGDEAKSVELAAEMDRINRQIILQQTSAISNQAAEQSREEIRVETAIERLEEIYPQLNERNDAYDPELVNFVLAEQRRLISDDAMPPSKALVTAASSVMKRFAPAPAPETTAAVTGLAAASKGATREAAAVTKRVDAALKTPPSTQDVGQDTDKAGMRDGLPVPMNVADLAALPEATLKRMRGDIL